jgi:hypothetical protein
LKPLRSFLDFKGKITIKKKCEEEIHLALDVGG